MSEQELTTEEVRKNNYPKNRKTRPAIDRFMERVDQSGSCWEWTARKFWDGYGIFYVGRATVRAHRWAYEHFIGPIPEGLVIDHLCRNRACVNPKHLEPVTNRENLMRGEGVSAKAARAIQCPQGHSYDEKNTRVATDGSRVCRECHRVQQNKARRAKMHHFTDEELAAHDAEVVAADRASQAEWQAERDAALVEVYTILKDSMPETRTGTSPVEKAYALLDAQDYTGALAEVRRAAAAEALRDFTDWLRETYPWDVFTPLTAEESSRVNALLKDAGVVRDRLSAAAMRHAASLAEARSTAIEGEGNAQFVALADAINGEGEQTNE